MAKMTEYELVAACRYQASRAAGSETAADELTESRRNAIRYYLGRPRGDEVDGESGVISMDVADTIHAMISQMMPVFKNDTVVNFEAESEEDEKQARIEADFCNYMVMEKNNGYILFQTALKDAMLSKNSIAKVYVDEREDVETERYKGLTEVEIMTVMQPTSDDQIVDVTKFDEKSGDINIKRVTTTRKLKVDPVPPENFATTTSLRSPFIQDSEYCHERFWRTRSELIEMGFDAEMVMQLPRATTDTKTDSIERNQIQDEQNFHNQRPEMQFCELEEHYIRIDYDGDGVGELRKVLTCENHFLETEEVPCIPYAAGVIVLMGHRFYGLSIFDILRYLQDSKTMFLRQWHNNAYTSNHNTTDVVEDQVEMEDFINGRSSAIRRVDSLDSCRSNPVNDIGPSMHLALDYLDKVRTERIGSALDFQTQQIKTPHNVGDAGVNTLMANLEQISSWMIGTFSETFVTQVYQLVHKFLRLYFPNEMNAKINGQWNQTNPSQWLEREQVNISVGLTKSERINQQVALEKIIAKQEQLILGGQNGVLADMEGYHRALIDHARMSGIDHPEKYWIDPNSDQAQQSMQMNQQAQEMQKQEALAAQNGLVQAQIMEVQRNWQNDIQELQQKNEQFYADLKFKYDELTQKTDVEEAKIVGSAVEKIELAGVNAELGRQASTENEEYEEAP